MYFSKEWYNNPNAVKPLIIQKYIRKQSQKLMVFFKIPNTATNQMFTVILKFFYENCRRAMQLRFMTKKPSLLHFIMKDNYMQSDKTLSR